MKTQLFKRLAEQIYADYASVGKLPGERSLGERYVASRATIRAALAELQQRGRLVSDARRGHTLIVEASSGAPAAPAASPVRKSFNVVVFCGSRLIEDQAFLDFLGGVISSGSRAGVNVIVREIEEKLVIAGVENAEQLYAGIEADGYILTFLSEGLRQFLERQLKPCVALGMADRIGELDKRRFIRVFLPQQEKVRLLFDRLTAQGHRRILVPCSEGLGKYICNLIPPGVGVDFVQIPF
ncbi:MAG: GntR family transcriptional regulator, partial [Victivallaceae bacterium]